MGNAEYMGISFLIIKKATKVMTCCGLKKLDK